MNGELTPEGKMTLILLGECLVILLLLAVVALLLPVANSVV